MPLSQETDQAYSTCTAPGTYC